MKSYCGRIGNRRQVPLSIPQTILALTPSTSGTREPLRGHVVYDRNAIAAPRTWAAGAEQPLRTNPQFRTCVKTQLTPELTPKKDDGRACFGLDFTRRLREGFVCFLRVSLFTS
jgi:hypothetical protein